MNLIKYAKRILPKQYNSDIYNALEQLVTYGYSNSGDIEKLKNDIQQYHN